MLLLFLTMIGCYQKRPKVLNEDEFKVIDTTYVAKNGWGSVLGYDVIIEIDSFYYSGSLNPKKELIHVNPRKLKFRNNKNTKKCGNTTGGE